MASPTVESDDESFPTTSSASRGMAASVEATARVIVAAALPAGRGRDRSGRGRPVVGRRLGGRVQGAQVAETTTQRNRGMRNRDNGEERVEHHERHTEAPRREGPAQHARVGGQQHEGTQVPAARLLAARRAHELLGEDLAHELARRHPAIDERDDGQPPRLGAVDHNRGGGAEVDRRGTERVGDMIHPLARLRGRTRDARDLAVRGVKHEADRESRAHDEARPPCRVTRDEDDESHRRKAHGDEADEVRGPAEGRAGGRDDACGTAVHPTHVRGNTRTRLLRSGQGRTIRRKASTPRSTRLKHHGEAHCCSPSVALSDLSAEASSLKSSGAIKRRSFVDDVDGVYGR